MLTAYRNIVNWVQNIMVWIQKGLTLEAREKRMELIEANMALREENQKLTSENQSLKNQSAISNSLVWEPPVHWRGKDEERKGPYCQVCWHRSHQLVELNDDSYDFHCEVCDKFFEKPNCNRPKFEDMGPADPGAGY